MENTKNISNQDCRCDLSGEPDPEVLRGAMDRGIFDKSKKVWEDNIKIFPESVLQYPAENLVRLFSGKYVPIPKPPATVMDHGFGHGNNLVFVSSKGYDCAGCEISDHLIEMAHSIFKGLGNNIDLRPIRDMDIPFEDNRFDIVISWDVIHYNGTREAVDYVIAELYRVLRPGGVLLLSTVNPENSIFDRMESLGGGTYEIVEESPYDNRKNLTFFVADSQNDLSKMFSMFTEVKLGNLYYDLYSYENRHSAYLVYGVK